MFLQANYRQVLSRQGPGTQTQGGQCELRCYNNGCILRDRCQRCLFKPYGPFGNILQIHKREYSIMIHTYVNEWLISQKAQLKPL